MDGPWRRLQPRRLARHCGGGISIFAEQARARIAEIEAARQRVAEEERNAANRYQAEGRIKVEAQIVHWCGALHGWFKPGRGKPSGSRTPMSARRWSWCQLANS